MKKVFKIMGTNMASKKAQQLIEIFKKIDIDSCIDFFVENDCRNDREIIELVKEWSQLAYSCRNNEQYAQKAKIEKIQSYARHRDVFYAAEFCLGKLTEKTTGVLSWRDFAKLRVIAQRHGNDWIRKWCEYLKKDSLGYWSLLRDYYKEGLCDRPEDDSYYIGLMYFGNNVI